MDCRDSLLSKDCPLHTKDNEKLLQLKINKYQNRTYKHMQVDIFKFHKIFLPSNCKKNLIHLDEISC